MDERIWYKESGEKTSYAKYQWDDITVYVGSRPDVWGVSESFFNSIDGWMSVTDRFINNPARLAWFPWVEESNLPNSVLYPSMLTLHYWLKVLKLKTIYIHCDAGTHRAPTIFGTYLNLFEKDRSREIVDGVTLYNRQLSDPLYYFNEKLKLGHIDKDFFEEIKNVISNYNSRENKWGFDSIEIVNDRIKKK